jgi:hypothetical protein
VLVVRLREVRRTPGLKLAYKATKDVMGWTFTVVVKSIMLAVWTALKTDVNDRPC